ncbi:unnamed protein product, partial [Closterium sp. NIES-53]
PAVHGGGSHRCVSLSPRCISLDLHNLISTRLHPRTNGWSARTRWGSSRRRALTRLHPLHSSNPRTNGRTAPQPSPPLATPLHPSPSPRTPWQGRTYTVEELTEESFKGVDIALFSAGGSISKKFGPAAVAEGTIVVDNSSAFRMTDGVPLVVPEVSESRLSCVDGARNAK